MAEKVWTEAEEIAWAKTVEEEGDAVALEKLADWLVPKTEGFFQAPSGYRLHVRPVLPPDDPACAGVKAVVLYCHGLNSHVNARIWAQEFYPKIASGGFAVFAMDIQGHGYSEGPRAFLEDWEDVFADWEAYAEALLGEDAREDGRFGAGIPAEALARLKGLPVFVMGTSMGGMIALQVALRLQRNPRLKDRIRGAVMVSPALAVDLPPKPVQCLLRSLVVPLCKSQEMPAGVSSSSKPKTRWSFDLNVDRDREVAAMEIRDCASRFPGKGLGWHKGMRWALAGAFSKVYSELGETMREVHFPFFIMHDPGDRVCMISGSKNLMELAPSKDKSLEEANAKGLHCLPLVLQQEVAESATAWMRKRCT